MDGSSVKCQLLREGVHYAYGIYITYTHALKKKYDFWGLNVIYFLATKPTEPPPLPLTFLEENPGFLPLDGTIPAGLFKPLLDLNKHKNTPFQMFVFDPDEK